MLLYHTVRAEAGKKAREAKRRHRKKHHGVDELDPYFFIAERLLRSNPAYTDDDDNRNSYVSQVIRDYRHQRMHNLEAKDVVSTAFSASLRTMKKKTDHQRKLREREKKRRATLERRKSRMAFKVVSPRSSPISSPRSPRQPRPNKAFFNSDLQQDS